VCSFVDFQHFAIVGHTATLFLHEYIKTRRFLLLFLFYGKQPLWPSLKTVVFTIMSSCQQCNKVLLLICKECCTITAHSRLIKLYPEPDTGNIWFAAGFTSFQFSVSCQTDKVSYDLGPSDWGWLFLMSPTEYVSHAPHLRMETDSVSKTLYLFPFWEVQVIFKVWYPERFFSLPSKKPS
jgi:hypothetical protein